MLADACGHVTVKLSMPAGVRASGARLRAELIGRERQKHAGGRRLDACFYHNTDVESSCEVSVVGAREVKTKIRLKLF